MPYIISKVKNDKVSIRDIGSKAKTLIDLKDMDFNVPDFFVISSDIEDFNLFKNDISEAFDKLNCTKVAVRSSAVGEDGIKKSFAGQYKSILNVLKENLIESIIDCRKSLNSTHAISYGGNEVINKMAVIVQKMIKADVSGVSFGADPVKKDKSVIIIESVDGPCELLVSGMVTPSHYVINKNKINEENISDNIKKVAFITKEIEDKLGYLSDIEWVICNNELYILQARPITTKLY